MDEELQQYRAGLIDTLRFLNEAYDKMLVTLAGGALALSMVFLSDVAPLSSLDEKEFLVGGWIAFVASLACVLGRIFTGMEAYRAAVRQVDEGTIYEQRAGGRFSQITRILHIASAGLLILGFFLVGVFIYQNVGVNHVEEGAKQETAIETTVATQGAPSTAATT